MKSDPSHKEHEDDISPNAVPPIPEGSSTVMPWIISRDTARLLEFMKQAFGAQELTRLYNAGGTITHAEARIGDSIIGPLIPERDGRRPLASCVYTSKMPMPCTNKPSLPGPSP